VLIHAGDLTQNGTTEELHAAVSWIASLPHPIKIVIAGNHDKSLDTKYRNRELLDTPEVGWELSGISYLEHAATQIIIHGRKLTVFGSPYTPEFGNWAFQYPPAHLLPEHVRNIWAAVLVHTDVLITHGPPFAHLDAAGMQRAGCRGLLERLWTVRPMLHVFGHIHASRGRETLLWSAAQRKLEHVSGDKGVASRLVHWAWSIIDRASRRGNNSTTLLVNACIQPGRRDAPLNDAEVVYI
jgi:hypothetical protein